MIFVSVGTHTQGFDRLVMAVDRLAEAGKIKEKVIMQIGNTQYEPKYCEWFRFESSKRIAHLNKTARIVIAHAGAGCIINALRFSRPLIIVPRYKRFGEHINDHQADLAKALELEKKAVAVYDTNELGGAIEKTGELRHGKKENILIDKLMRYAEGCGKTQRSGLPSSA